MTLVWKIWIVATAFSVGVFLGIAWQILYCIYKDFYNEKAFPKIPRWAKFLYSWEPRKRNRE